MPKCLFESILFKDKKTPDCPWTSGVKRSSLNNTHPTHREPTWNSRWLRVQLVAIFTRKPFIDVHNMCHCHFARNRDLVSKWHYCHNFKSNLGILKMQVNGYDFKIDVSLDKKRRPSIMHWVVRIKFTKDIINGKKDAYLEHKDFYIFKSRVQK